MKANPKGAAGEEYAAETLQGLGYKIVERNFRSRCGEIDIIAVKDDIIAFVEVKTRHNHSAVSGFAAVTPSKQRKIIMTAMWYMRTNGCELQPRFDVFSAVTAGGEIISHDYLEGAYDSGAYSKKHH